MTFKMTMRIALATAVLVSNGSIAFAAGAK